MELSEQERFRRDSLQQLRNLGIEPYPAAEFKVDAYSTDIKRGFVDIQSEEEKGCQCGNTTAVGERAFYTGDKVSVAGRIMSRRIMGKASFVEIQDSKGRIQVFVSADDIQAPTPEGEDSTSAEQQMYKTVFKKLLDIGDYIGIEGFVFRTKVGEISVHAERLVVLSKSIRPLPIVKYKDGVAYDEFTDAEQRYRQRYLDLVVNAGVKSVFEKRALIIKTMRQFFDEAGYTEVETPILQTIPGGANARPFITHHNSLDVDMYLRIATELYLKRLIIGGFEGVYEIGRNFRNEGMDKNHNPEFSCMELYVAYKDYYWMMGFTEQLLQTLATTVNGKTEIVIDNHTINFQAPFKRIKIIDSLNDKLLCNILEMTDDQLRLIAKKEGVEDTGKMGRGKLIDELFGILCESELIQPTFVMDYPIEMSPLTKRHRDNPQLTERFELFVNGKELANAYSELNDPIDQYNRFVEQMKLGKEGDDEAMIIDHDFIQALEYGMPPTSGIGIGIDRLTMLLTQQTSIQEVLFFPTMRPKL